MYKAHDRDRMKSELMPCVLNGREAEKSENSYQ